MGVAGYIAPKHLKAIHETGNNLVAAVDPSDSVGILDRYSLDVPFFKETERFDRHLFKLHRKSAGEKVHYVSICTPNYLHDAHIRLALRNGADAICEKPLVINPWNLDGLKELEEETGKKVFTVLQLRLHPALLALRERLASSKERSRVRLTYITGRGMWYKVSWKGSEAHSGGVATNIGIHLFDLMTWLFGEVRGLDVHVRTEDTVAGFMSLDKADVSWFLSLDTGNIPREMAGGGKNTYRSIRVGDDEIEFSEGFADLHTRVYEEVLAGRGFGIEEARGSIELVHKIRHSDVSSPEKGKCHPILEGGQFK